MMNDNLIATMVLFGDADDSVYNNNEWQGDLLEFTGAHQGFYTPLNAEDLYWIDSLAIETEEWAQWGYDIDAYIDTLGDPRCVSSEIGERQLARSAKLNYCPEPRISWMCLTHWKFGGWCKGNGSIFSYAD
jgi:hypothetical protein